MQSFGDLLGNILVGIVTGCISGWIVSLFFEKKSAIEQWKKELSDDKQTMSRYIELVDWELQQLMKGDGRETTGIIRLLKHRPRFKSFKDLNKIKPEHQGYTKDAYDLFREIEEFITYELPEKQYENHKIQYLKFHSRLLRAQWNILMINNELIEEISITKLNLEKKSLE